VQILLHGKDKRWHGFGKNGALMWLHGFGINEVLIWFHDKDERWHGFNANEVLTWLLQCKCKLCAAS